MAPLAETQEILWQLITAPEGVARGLADLSAAERERRLPLGLDGVVRGDERLSAVERLDIYANMYFFRLLDCLKEDYPALLAVVGATEFHNLITAYLVEHPSEHPSVRFVGRHVADFLETHELTRERPYLPALARLEWAIVEAFDAPDEEPVPVERLRALPSERWAEMRLRLTPSLRIVAANAHVEEIWRAVTEAGEIPAPPLINTALRVWRQDLRVFHRIVESAEAAVLRAVGAGRNFGEICELLSENLGIETAAKTALEILNRWLADGMIVGLESP